MFFTAICQARIYSLFPCLFKKSDALYILVFYKLVTFNNKFTIIEFPPFSLPPLSARFACVSRAIVFIFSLIPCAALFLLKLCRCDLFCRLDKFSLLKFLLSFLFVNVFLFFSLFFKKFTDIEMKV